MKCIKSESGEVKRVKESVASLRVKTGDWSYCPKAEWKEQKRKEKEKKETKKTNKKKKSEK